MDDRVAHRFEAVAHVAHELLGRKLGSGVERPVARPVVEVEQRLDIVESHG